VQALSSNLKACFSNKPKPEDQSMSKLSKFSLRPLATSLALAPISAVGAVQTTAKACFAQASKVKAQGIAKMVLAAVVLMAVMDPVFAQAGGGGGGDLTAFLQNLVNMITGPTGKMLAIIGVCVVGIGALMGALSLRAAGGVILGMMLIFSSSWIVTQVVGA
jgi:type IV secretory pathway VirB2 component (pilin)